MEAALSKLKERVKRLVIRKIQAGQITWDKEKKLFVYAEGALEVDFENMGADEDEIPEEEEEGDQEGEEEDEPI